MADSLQAAVRHLAEQPLRTLLQAPNVLAELNTLGSSGVNALGLAVWRNHEGLVQALLEAGADPNVQDSESGWSALHRALHFGQLRIAAALLQANANLSLPDWRGRSPLDLLSAELREFIEPGGDGDVFCFGNGSNYTLGTGSTDLQLHPARLESLHDQQIVAISAAKFHSAAVSVDGRLLTWGWGRGGRLGHPDAQLHSGDGAVIAPLVVTSLAKRCVAAVAAAKHHTVLCTTAGEVFTMGSNRHGQLGYAVDGQPTPRRVSSLRQRVVAVAAANKHSVAVTAQGDVYTWGANVLGQLGYGTSDSAANPAPRLVEAMRGKAVVAAAAAKRHTLVLTAGGEVFTWGHRGVSPRRVQLAGARDVLSAEGTAMTFHRGHGDVARPLAAAICAGAAHSSALTRAGVVLSWRSADPALQLQEVGGSLAGKRIVSISAGKYRTAAVSDEGDMFMWEGRSDYFPAEGRQPGSGSKKPPSSAGTKARAIPSGIGGSMRISLGGGEAPLGASYGAADASGSYGSHTRRPGSFIERFAREREASGGGSGLFGTSPTAAVAPGSAGAGSMGRMESSLGTISSRPSRASDVFEKIRPQRVEGLKRAVSAAVGEKHSLAVQRWSAAQLEDTAVVPWLQAAAPAEQPAAPAADDDQWYQQAADALAGQLLTPRGSVGERSSSLSSLSSPSPGRPSPVRPGPRRFSAAQAAGVPSLQRICEEEVARRLVDPRTCLQVLEYADVAGAELLRAYCFAVALCNLDAVLLEAGGAFEQLPPHLLAELERLYKLRLAGAGSGAAGGVAAALEPAALPAEGAAEAAAGRKLRQEVARLGSRLQLGSRPTAAAPWLADEGSAAGGVQSAVQSPSSLLQPTDGGGSSFRDRSQANAEAAAARLLRTLQKKLQQIEHLEAKAAAGTALDPQQAAKVQQRPVILSAVAALEGGMALHDVHSILKALSVGRDAEAGRGLAPGSSSKAPGSALKGRSSKKSAAAAVPAAAEASFASAAAEDAALELAVADLGADLSSSCVLGSSPPSASLVPAFGFAGSAAIAADQPGTPVGRVRSLVGFASSSTTDGVAAAAQRSPGQQEAAAGARLGASTKAKSASKRKGGLSMFLRGELEQAAAPAAAEQQSGSDTGGGGTTAAPAAWGARAAVPAATASLKQILDQEAMGLQPQGSGSKPPMPQRGGMAGPGSGLKYRAQDLPAGAAASAAAASAAPAPLRMTLQSFIAQSSPVAVTQHRGEGASPPPVAWGGSSAAGGSPPSQQTSFLSIQQQQQAAAPPRPAVGTSPPAAQRLGGGLPPWRPPHPPLSSAGATAALLGTSPSASSGLLGTSPSGRSFLAAPLPQHSKWYVPEEEERHKAQRKSLKSIQTEEEDARLIAALEAQYQAEAAAQAAAAAKAAKAAAKRKAAKVAKSDAPRGMPAAPGQPGAAAAPALDPQRTLPAQPQPKPAGGRPAAGEKRGGRPGGADKASGEGRPPRGRGRGGGRHQPSGEQASGTEARPGAARSAGDASAAAAAPKRRRPPPKSTQQPQQQHRQQKEQRREGRPEGVAPLSHQHTPSSVPAAPAAPA